MRVAPTGIGLIDWLTGGLGGSDLRIEYVHQKQSNWCWAACSEMICEHLGRPKTQCRIVEAGLGQQGCCSDGESTVCNRMIAAHSSDPNEPDIERVLESVGVHATYVDGTLQPGELLQELNSGRPVIACLDGGSTGGHVVLVVGWRPGNDEENPLLAIHDPQREARPHFTYDDLFSAFGHGRWVATVRGIS